jgi:hypothetical protein
MHLIVNIALKPPYDCMILNSFGPEFRRVDFYLELQDPVRLFRYENYCQTNPIYFYRGPTTFCQ